MDPNSGRLFPSVEAAREAGVEDAVEIRGTEEAVMKVADAVAAQSRQAHTVNAGVILGAGVRGLDGEALSKPRRTVPRGSTHRHDMRASDESGVLRCASCIFRCEDSKKVLAKVQANSDLHMIITKRSPEDLKEVYRG